ncbi:MAG: peptide deformylase [Candidatus Latescibacterota bacterium]|nr:peptide deformylase [Candidatus Latescibacterota bacterium]
MIRDIVKYGSRVLRQVAEPVARVDQDTQSLIKDLFDTLGEADGVGLAAPQIGVSLRVIVVDVTAQDRQTPPLAFVNPVIKIGHGMATAEEGCLSIPDLYGEISRYDSVEVTAVDQNGESFEIKSDGFYARILQHEIDHLDGRLFIDHLAPLKRQLLRGALKRIKKEGEVWDERHLPA